MLLNMNHMPAMIMTDGMIATITAVRPAKIAPVWNNPTSWQISASITNVIKPIIPLKKPAGIWSPGRTLEDVV